ncbi:MAG: hypothetical protein AAF196_09290 [Planctomycetota bacterium]
MTSFLRTLAIAALIAGGATAQLRIVTYNTNTFGTEPPGSSLRPPRAGVELVIRAIGEEVVAGIRRPADIILLQEQQQPDTTTQILVNSLNAAYQADGITYARGFEVGTTTGGSGLGPPNSSEIRQAVIYRTDTVELIDEDSFGSISGTNQPRETMLHHFRPVGYGASADLFVFNSHFEAGDSTGFGGDRFARESESTDIRNFITASGLGLRNVMLAGDLNVDSNFELSGTPNFGGRSSLQILSDGSDASGRLLDPLFPAGGDVTFRNNSSLADQLTQSPSGGAGALVGGGIDDRFDFLLQSDELLDSEGLASIPGTYRVFGNNGSTFNDQINDGNTIQLAGLTSFSTAEVLNALESASDHLPVVQDFQLPGILSAELGTMPPTLAQGETFNLEIDITNAAPVETSNGADELEYTVSALGAASGAASGTAMAATPAQTVTLTLDTSSLGSQTALAIVATTSQQAENASIALPIAFEVVPAISAAVSPLLDACDPSSANNGIDLVVESPPIVGSNLRLSINDATGTVVSAFFLLGPVATTPLDLDSLGNTDCDLQIDLGAVFFLASNTPASPSTLLTIPSDTPSVLGLQLAAQALCVTNGPTVFVPSDTLALVFGNQ